MPIDKGLQSALQEIINWISQIEGAVSGAHQKLQMTAGVFSRVVALMQNSPAPLLQLSRIAVHRGAVQNQPLLMNSQRPAGIGSEKERILDQSNRPTWLKRRMLSKQLMGIDKADLHSSHLAGKSAGPTAQRRGITTIDLSGTGAENLGAAIHDNFFTMTLLIIQAHH